MVAICHLVGQIMYLTMKSKSLSSVTHNQSIMVGMMKAPRLSKNFTQFAFDSKSGEEFLYLFSENEWNGFSINHKYDDDLPF